ncbi:MAG: hypothetical protein WCF84_20435 [Anaerolineae bacterium]
MSKYEVVGVRAETDGEKAQREWFQKAVQDSPARLEEAARLFIGLVTGLIGVLFTVLSIVKNPQPQYLDLPGVRVFGAGVVVLLLISLGAALFVVVPGRWTFNPAVPASEVAVFNEMLRRKSTALTLAAVFFGLGVLALAVVLMIVFALAPVATVP